MRIPIKQPVEWKVRCFFGGSTDDQPFIKVLEYARPMPYTSTDSSVATGVIRSIWI